MSAPFLIIDGYNLLYAAGMGQIDYQPGDLQHCRERLLRFLAARIKPAQLPRALVIFDARDPPPDLPARRRQHGMQILFAQPHGDADVMIEELISDHPQPRQVVLVSSDQRLRRSARAHRAKSIPSEEFFAQLQNAAQSAAVDEDRLKHGSVSALETERWLEAFGAIELKDEPLPPALLAKSGRPPIEKPKPSEKPKLAEPAAKPVRKATRSATTTRTTRVTRPVSPPEPAPLADSPPAKPSRRKHRAKQSPLPADRRQLTNDDLAYWLEVFRDLPER